MPGTSRRSLLLRRWASLLLLLLVSAVSAADFDNEDLDDFIITATASDPSTDNCVANEDDDLDKSEQLSDNCWDVNTFHLFDLSVDESENVDLGEVDLWGEALSDLQDRLAYWNDVANAASVPSNPSPDDAAFALWDEMGGTVPWLPGAMNGESSFIPTPPQSSLPTTTTTTSTTTSAPPNIVFVLVDDWGYNAGGLSQSTFLNWTQPTINEMAANGVVLDRYYTAWSCAPSRASFLTGRNPVSLGAYSGQKPLAPEESTLAEELRNYGYRTALVGKWHLGFSNWTATPRWRGFDTFYGFYAFTVDYWSKTYLVENDDEEILSFLDLHDNEHLVDDEDELTEHATLLFQRKVNDVIMQHSVTAEDAPYAGQPLFLYYSMLATHALNGLVDDDPTTNETKATRGTVPDEYAAMCTSTPEHIVEDDELDYQSYCAHNIMVDEAVGSTICALETAGILSNTLIVVSGDNGGEARFKGANYPLRGGKSLLTEGGTRNHALLFSTSENLVPMSARGMTYSGLVHISDWLPTLMRIATDGGWGDTLLSGLPLDGVDVYDAVMLDLESPRTEVIYNLNPATGDGAIQNAAGHKLLNVSNIVEVFEVEDYPQPTGEELPSICATALNAELRFAATTTNGGGGTSWIVIGTAAIVGSVVLLSTKAAQRRRRGYQPLPA